MNTTERAKYNADILTDRCLGCGEPNDADHVCETTETTIPHIDLFNVARLTGIGTIWQVVAEGSPEVRVLTGAVAEGTGRLVRAARAAQIDVSVGR